MLGGGGVAGVFRVAPPAVRCQPQPTRLEDHRFGLSAAGTPAVVEVAKIAAVVAVQQRGKTDFQEAPAQLSFQLPAQRVRIPPRRWLPK